MLALAADADVRDDDLIGSYAGLVLALVRRRQALRLSQEEVDYRAGFSSNFTSHLERWDHPMGRRCGDVTLQRWMGALGVALRLEVVEDVEPGQQRGARPNRMASQRRVRASAMLAAKADHGRHL